MVATARSGTHPQMGEVLIGFDEHVLGDVLSLDVVAGEADRGREDHVLIGTHKSREFG